MAERLRKWRAIPRRLGATTARAAPKHSRAQYLNNHNELAQGSRARTVSHLCLNSDYCIDTRVCIVNHMKTVGSLAANNPSWRPQA